MMPENMPFWRRLSSFFASVSFLAMLVIGGSFLIPQTVQAGNCDCLCVTSTGATGAGGPSCDPASTTVQCSYSVCRDYCSNLFGTSFLPAAAPNGGRAYQCLGEAGTSNTGNTQSPGTSNGNNTGSNTGNNNTTNQPTGNTNTGSNNGSPSPTTDSPGTPTNNTTERTGATLRFSLPACTSDGNCSLTDIINTGIRFANFLLGLSGIIFLGTFLYAGANLIFFANDAKSYSNAQGMLKGAVTGIVIVMVAGVAVRFVSSTLGVNSSLLRTPGRSTRSSTTQSSTTGGTPAPTNTPAR